MAEKRTRSLRIRVTEEEHSAFIEKSGDSPVSEWIRSFATDAVAEKKHKVPKVDPAFLRQLAGIGNNLNQIARVVNTKKRAIDRTWLLSELVDIEEALWELRADAYDGRWDVQEDVEGDRNIS